MEMKEIKRIYEEYFEKKIINQEVEIPTEEIVKKIESKKTGKVDNNQ